MKPGVSIPLHTQRRLLTSHPDQRAALRNSRPQPCCVYVDQVSVAEGLGGIWSVGVNNLSETSSIIKLSPEGSVLPQALPHACSQPHPCCVPGPERLKD